jgi:predicted ABC-type ATPase
MNQKRMRVFAGPNGSGKTTIFKGMLSEAEVELGVYVNADDIERALNEKNVLDFDWFQLKVSEDQLKYFFQTSTFSPIKRQEPDLWTKLSVTDNFVEVAAKVDSYLAADLAEFIRQQLLRVKISFTYETVMSHPGKIDFFRKARENGYRVYLYYIATLDPEINISRVNVRVAQEGHAVLPDVIRSRYFKSLKNLKAAVKQTNRAYIFDNSGEQAKFIAEIAEGTNVSFNDVVALPSWVQKYLLD